MKTLAATAVLATACVLAARVDVPAVATPGFEPVWADEFDKDGPPDPSKWTYETGFLRNDELQWYQPQNATCRGGQLVIEGRRERVPNPSYRERSSDWRTSRAFADYTSASLMTKGLAAWRYGRFVMRGRIGASRARERLGVLRGLRVLGGLAERRVLRETLHRRRPRTC